MWEGQRESERKTGQEKKKQERGRKKNENWNSSWQQIGSSHDKCHPLYPQWEYSPVLSYQLPVPCPGPTDTGWPSVNQPVRGRELETADSDRCSLSVPSSHWHTVIMVYSSILNAHKTLKGKGVPCSADVNQASPHMLRSSLPGFETGLRCSLNEENHCAVCDT